MIGMMYLVLTALLAMNVSKDILDAFVVINEGLETTNKNFMAKNDITYAQFEKANLNDPLKVGKYWIYLFEEGPGPSQEFASVWLFNWNSLYSLLSKYAFNSGLLFISA